MPTKVWFIRKVHNKIQINKFSFLKKCKIQIDKNIERVQVKQQDTNKQKNKKMILKWIQSMTNYNSKWSKITTMTITKIPSYINQFQWNIITRIIQFEQWESWTPIWSLPLFKQLETYLLRISPRDYHQIHVFLALDILSSIPTNCLNLFFTTKIQEKPKNLIRYKHYLFNKSQNQNILKTQKKGENCLASSTSKFQFCPHPPYTTKHINNKWWSTHPKPKNHKKFIKNSHVSQKNSKNNKKLKIILYFHKCAFLPKTTANKINHYTKTALNDGKQKLANCFNVTKRTTWPKIRTLIPCQTSLKPISFKSFICNQFVDH
jgi:hypothetical protein